MKLQLISNPTRQFNVPEDVAQILLLMQGTPVEAVPSPPEPRVPKSGWVVQRTLSTGEPCITVNCASCKNVGNYMGPTAHKTQKFYHCGVAEPVPAHIAAEYEEIVRERRRRP